MTIKAVVEITARNFDELPQTLVLAEVAALCSMTYGGAYGWIERGHLKARKASGVWLIDKYDLRRFISKRGIVLIYPRSEQES